jgi:hypothetical protein
LFSSGDGVHTKGESMLIFARLAAVAAVVITAGIFVHCEVLAGPYSAGLDDPTNITDAPVPGFVGPDGEGKARLDDGFGGFENARNYVNPLFFGWAVDWTNYLRSDIDAPSSDPTFGDPSRGLGPVTGDNFDVVSLGDLDAAQIGAGQPSGELTLQIQPIRNLPGADFVIFENGLASEYDTGGAGVNGVFGELAYVEVSSDGIHFARFPSISLTPSAVGDYGSIDPTDVFNLAGKHANAYGECWGTPFDLSALAEHPLVVAGTVDLNAIRYIRLVDIPGNGSFFDEATPTPHPIYDSWWTYGSGGFDLEAVGAVSVPVTFDEWQDRMGLAGGQRGVLADPDDDGVPNVVECAMGMRPLVPDLELLPVAESATGALAISFRRDTRPTNLIVEVLGTNDLRQPWQVIARSQGGSAFAAVAPFSPTIEDTSDSHIASVGVIRRQRVHAAPGQRFLRIAVSVAP